MNKSTKVVVPAVKPRNPLVAAVKLRQAGAHGGHLAQRRRRREGKKELRSLIQGAD